MLGFPTHLGKYPNISRPGSGVGSGTMDMWARNT